MNESIRNRAEVRVSILIISKYYRFPKKGRDSTGIKENVPDREYWQADEVREKLSRKIRL
jgi:hypothetical protein